MKSGKKGFTLVEIIIVVGILGLLVALTVPNFITAWQTGRKNVCTANMRQIGNAVEMWATQENKSAGDVPNMGDLVPSYLKRWPSCGGLPYGIPAVGDNSSCPCGIIDHKL
ncbi:MAG: prepilin-type N-terminal cleavage/methylation domain-containing protein [Candidatus Omnitrophica bacterium]|nr:prepilin-type N-terminal cleavage/methylation domain-containing protein [Candidatus Omnitrophota bacterium]